ncbi:hypothetical protein Leryth_006482 [Lithospermum erythrorhizon]|nr:hypothetical protein Leryth_006482 [Lithospermum erythrorhizon]
MDRRSWLWKRRSSEKSHSGEAESSGSGSSQSERFSGDQALLYHNAQSPEITSKAVEEEEVTDSVAALAEKLSEALLNIQEKEDLVKQHAKVAEDAVSGWEKAENEVAALRKQIEILTQKNSVLDEALKECLRQLRQAREEQQRKILDAVSQKSMEWESTKHKLESQVAELQSQHLHNTSEASADPDIRSKLEASEKENSILILQINSLREELKFITHERDLSSQAAETASKQRLDGIKKVAKLEAECRRLKAAAHRATQATDNRSRSSTYVESLTDSQSDSGERLSATENDSKMDSGIDCMPSNLESWAFASKAESDKYKKEKASVSNNFMSSSLEVNLMDDFLEMERQAALPQMQSGIRTDSMSEGRKISFNAEFEAMISRTTDLEEKLEMVEVEKMKLEMSLNECENQLKTSKIHLEQTESKLEALNTKLVLETEARKSVEAANARLETSKEHIDEMEVHMAELQTLLAITSEGKHNAEVELENTRIKLRKSMEYLEKMEVELVELQSQLAITNEAKLMAELEIEASKRKLNKSMDRLEDMQRYLAEVQNQLATSNEAKGMVELELEATNIKLQQASEDLDGLEAYIEHLRNQLQSVREEKNKAEVEIETATKSKDIAESQLEATKVEMQTLLSKIIVLEDEVQRHRALADEAVDKCMNLDIEISRFKHLKPENFGELKIKQDKELAMAAKKFTDCQKTIASLSQQLKSLATIEEFLLD